MQQDLISRFFGGPPLWVALRLIFLSVLVGIVLSALGLDRLKQLALNAANGNRHREPEIRVGAKLRILQRSIERRREQRARHLDRHALTDPINAAGPTAV